MIRETEYVTIAQAAELVKADAESILGAALSGVLKLYWLMDMTIDAELVYWEPGDDESPSSLMVMNKEFRYFSFVPLANTSLSAILNNGSANVSNDPMSLPDDDGYWWQADSESRSKLPAALGQKSIFAKRSDCVVSPQAQEMNTRSRNTLLLIIAAVLKDNKVNYTDRGTAKYIERLTQQLGAAVGEDTIKKILDDIPDVMKNRKKSREKS